MSMTSPRRVTRCLTVIMAFIAFLPPTVDGCARLPWQPNQDEQQPPSYYVCGRCGNPIEFTLVVRNVAMEPTFQFNITLTEEPEREAIHLLEKAAKLDKRFEFSSSYHHKWGYFLTTVNGQASKQEGNVSYYWMLSDFLTGDFLMSGLSSHVPQHQDVVLFNFTSFTY